MGLFGNLLKSKPAGAPVIPSVPVLSAARATDLYGTPDGDPHSEWARKHIVYCGGNGKAEKPALPGVPPHLWFAVHRRAEPKLREAFSRAIVACPTYTIGSAGCWVYRHQRHDPRRPLSNHSWGAAVDVDAALNGGKSYAAGKEPKPWDAAWRKAWPGGLPQEWVEAFLSVGGIGWGGAWRGYIDPMHLEVFDPD